MGPYSSVEYKPESLRPEGYMEYRAYMPSNTTDHAVHILLHEHAYCVYFGFVVLILH